MVYRGRIEPGAWAAHPLCEGLRPLTVIDRRSPEARFHEGHLTVGTGGEVMRPSPNYGRTARFASAATGAPNRRISIVRMHNREADLHKPNPTQSAFAKPTANTSDLIGPNPTQSR